MKQILMHYILSAVFVQKVMDRRYIGQISISELNAGAYVLILDNLKGNKIVDRLVKL